MQKAAARVVGGSDVCANELQVTRAALVRYRSAMAGVVRSIGVLGATVEDVVHDAFEMACRKPELERPDPRDERGFQAWLCTLAKYAALTARNDNARSREVASPAENLENVPDLHRANVSQYEDRADAAVVLSNLDADDRSLLHEHFYEEKTIQELAVERGVPWTTMRSRLDGVIHRARTIVDDRAVRRRGLVASAFLWLSVSITEFASRFSGNWSKKNRLVAAGAVGLMMSGVALGVIFDAHNDLSQLAISHFSIQSSAFRLLKTRASASTPKVVPAAIVEPTVAPAAKTLVVSPVVAAPAIKTAPKTNSQKAPIVEDEDLSRSITPWAVLAANRDHVEKGK